MLVSRHASSIEGKTGNTFEHRPHEGRFVCAVLLDATNLLPRSHSELTESFTSFLSSHQTSTDLTM